ncbi:DUF7676 family protein [Mycolicibacter sinensis]|uniref:DUF7676 family protein n=1 Tax=Mycolicibacter sinensis (strain JDM601) TaxID=875328 RepID=UPI003D161ACF
MWFGTILHGAAWEVVAPNAPERMSVADGYATVDFGRWHFHLRIGNHIGATADRKFSDHHGLCGI